jgi:hypothetical protein
MCAITEFFRTQNAGMEEDEIFTDVDSHTQGGTK